MTCEMILLRLERFEPCQNIKKYTQNKKVSYKEKRRESYPDVMSLAFFYSSEGCKCLRIKKLFRILRKINRILHFTLKTRAFENTCFQIDLKFRKIETCFANS